MNFVFSRLFYLLLAGGLILLSLSWGRPWLGRVTLAYDILLLILVLVDSRISRLPGITIAREFGGRFAVGAETEVRIQIQNHTSRDISIIVKDEHPPAMHLSGLREGQIDVAAQHSAALVYQLKPPRRGRFEFGRIAVRFVSRLGLVWCDMKAGENSQMVKVYPNMSRAREAELKALGARALVAQHRKTSWRGEGREFESMRDYVRGDELRHISWTATARRGKLTTRQYQIERDQNVLIALMPAA
jgi:uncharacterized protein (DUF58 family)